MGSAIIACHGCRAPTTGPLRQPWGGRTVAIGGQARPASCRSASRRASRSRTILGVMGGDASFRSGPADGPRARSAPEQDAKPATHVRGLNRSCPRLLAPPQSYDGKWAVASDFWSQAPRQQGLGDAGRLGEAAKRARAPHETRMAYGCRLAESLGATRTRSPASSFR